MKKPQQSGELLVPRVIALLTKNTMFSYLISGFFFPVYVIVAAEKK